MSTNILNYFCYTRSAPTSPVPEHDGSANDRACRVPAARAARFGAPAPKTPKPRRSFLALRRSGWNPTNRGSAIPADEWLQARIALSIEIFCRTPPLGSSPRRLRLEGLANCVIRGNRALGCFPASPQPPWMRANDRHPFVDAEDVHGGPDSPRDPLIDRLRQLGPLHCRGAEGYLSNKNSILSASAACSHSSTGSERTSGRETGCNQIGEEPESKPRAVCEASCRSSPRLQPPRVAKSSGALFSPASSGAPPPDSRRWRTGAIPARMEPGVHLDPSRCELQPYHGSETAAPCAANGPARRPTKRGDGESSHADWPFTWGTKG